MIFELGPPRRTFTDKLEAVKFINKYNGMKKAVYKTVYKFEEMNGIKPNYNSAIIDRLFFDFDKENAYEEAKRFHLYLLGENIKHTLTMSGRGYHIFVKTIQYKPQYSKSVIYNAQHHFIDKLELHCDHQVVGDNARLCRVPNTYHTKAKRFCIPLTKEQFYMGDKEIKVFANKQNFVKEKEIGENLFGIRQFDFENENEFKIEFEDCYVCEDCDLKILPDLIKNLLLKGDLKWRERYIVILYFKDLGYTMEEVKNILRKYLTEKKFKHCVYEERQLQYLFEREDLVFPEKYGIKIYK